MWHSGSYFICFIILYLKAVGTMLVMFVTVCFVLFSLIILYHRAGDTFISSLAGLMILHLRRKNPLRSWPKADKKRYSKQISDYRNLQATAMDSGNESESS